MQIFELGRCRNLNEKFTAAIIIPSYLETEALPELLSELVPYLTQDTVVIVVDDSPREILAEIETKCTKAIKGGLFSLVFESNGRKNGRGMAVLRGMNLALELYPNLVTVLECDADGSHRPEDISKLLRKKSSADLLVGSRYLPESKIIGWPFSRRLFSCVLNQIIPKFLSIPLSDITNGLRRYSIEATKLIARSTPKNKGFIFLSEQAQMIHENGMVIEEVPITFIDRTLGSSTVSYQEILKSLLGILLLITRRNLRFK